MMQDIQSLREYILKKENLQVQKVFDTNEHEPNKDVILVKDRSGQLIVLRLGELRTPGVFVDGYQGKYIVIPKLIKVVNRRDVIYEIEEYLEGDLVCDVVSAPKSVEILPKDVLLKLVQAHWEFQEVAEEQFSSILKPSWSREKNLEKFFKAAQKLINPEQQAQIEKIIRDERWKSWWRPDYPCKWKFSADNLILMPDGRIGFIDLARVSKRYWGYDLGWVFWSRWFHFADDEYKKAKEHFHYLQDFFQLVYEHTHEREDRKLFFIHCNLILLERILGSLYDVSKQISHAQRNIGAGKRQELFVEFLHQLLKNTLEKLMNVH